MTDDLFTIEVVDGEAEDVRIVTVSGEVDLSNAQRLEVALYAAFEGWTAGVVDLSGCEYIDSSGLNALVRFRQATQARLSVAVVVGPSTRRVLDIAGLAELFPIYSSRAEALEETHGSL